MVYHCNRLTLETGVTQEQLDEALESLRNQGRVIPSVRHFSVFATTAASTNGAPFSPSTTSAVIGST